MDVIIMAVGKTDNPQLSALIEVYRARLAHYLNFELVYIPDLKNTKKMSVNEQKEREGELVLKKINKSDVVVLLDEHGKQFSSIQFADFFQKMMNAGHKRLLFVIGGPYGFSEALYARGNQKISLSKMTFSHQMVRLFAIEQCYRAMTILKNEPYHHR
ncbi:23S rRNA (pseudouridine(1915)-N(3))-methyltransferase RlmH [Flavobacteriaceae bacterium F08102]|nr:23S rRNA (pseudouridine(1915)-N(3))-methyltransferase RlmH [Flavobacteriaceae bacterium F08102]